MELCALARILSRGCFFINYLVAKVTPLAVLALPIFTSRGVERLGLMVVGTVTLICMTPATSSGAAP